ncbi:MAG: DUF3578 domain-containing protein [Erysipelotrichales bacterium]|nr:DUF3578 domain-containing protein [Erysipelotrichales bacterium]
MTLKDFIVEISKQYLVESEKDFKHNNLAQYIRNLPKKLELTLFQNSYNIFSSPGKGGWAKIPWFGFFDNDISAGAQKGYYIVYLFTKDMTGIYISLNQGWTYYQKKYQKQNPKEKVGQVSSYWKNVLINIPKDFSVDEIILSNDKDALAKGYELGNICSKYYEIKSLTEEHQLEFDLQKMATLYNELKCKLCAGDYELTNSRIISENISFLEREEYRNETRFTLNRESFKDIKFNEHQVPNIVKIKKERSFTSIKKDYVSDKAIEVGYLGELAILEMEIKKLKESKNPYIKELAKKVRHASVKEGDGCGYDILSYNFSGEEIFIEVKTTVKDENSNFYITANELEFSTKNNSNYFLYRVFNFGKSDKKVDYYVLKGNLENSINLDASIYIAFPKANKEY